jgi:hypothetical protein
MGTINEKQIQTSQPDETISLVDLFAILTANVPTVTREAQPMLREQEPNVELRWSCPENGTTYNVKLTVSVYGIPEPAELIMLKCAET